ncbi:hypothetical protein ACKI2N_028140 [Cupriavidus sp. 30B13]|uniref:hypothetical protein n=1 Tax=Cupriavidus sp. 30B13 TaxID=3384241 RepID=UPI003B8FC71F
MKRFLSCFLLCLAMIALPAQGTAAAVMMVCSTAQSIQAPSRQALPAMAAMAVDSPAIESMMVRHAAVKSAAETALAGGHCHETAAAHEMADSDDTAMATSADHVAMHRAGHAAGQHAGSHHTDHHAGHGANGTCSACAACAAGAVMPTVLPELALASHGHAAPQAALAAFTGFLPIPSDRPPAARC